MVVIVHFLGNDALRDFAGAIGARDGGNFMLARCEKGFCDILANGAGGLTQNVS